jgi:hypothetical protein
LCVPVLSLSLTILNTVLIYTYSLSCVLHSSPSSTITLTSPS